MTDDWMTAADFERLVVDELDALPDEMVEGIENVVFVVEDDPPGDEPDLLGLYTGVAVTHRERYGFGELPDRIVLFRRPLLARSRSARELREDVHVTLVHEIGHYWGLDDDRLHELGWS